MKRLLFLLNLGDEDGRLKTVNVVILPILVFLFLNPDSYNFVLIVAWMALSGFNSWATPDRSQNGKEVEELKKQLKTVQSDLGRLNIRLFGRMQKDPNNAVGA